MKNVIREEIMPGVFLTTVHTYKFKTNYLSVNLLRPLNSADSTKNAILPKLLRRGTANHPDMEKISCALDDMYGARIEAIVRKKGEVQAIGFIGAFIDESYVPTEFNLFEKVAHLLGDLLLNPATRGGRFVPDYLESEKEKLIERINSQINEKRSYSLLKLVEHMCAGEPYGISKQGNVKAAEELTNGKLTKYYREILGTSNIELFYCGSVRRERVERIFKEAFAGLPRGERVPVSTDPKKEVKSVKRVEEALDVSQCCLTMGFRTCCSVKNADYPAMMLFNAVFGGTATSKLFMNVREKLSLCYYASSTLEKQKGLMLVSSGVDEENCEAAYDEILNQLEACKRGDIEDWEFEGAKSTLLSALKGIQDSPAALEDFYLGQAISELDFGPDELAADIEKVSLAEVVCAANMVQLDTVFRLIPKKEQEAAE